MRNIFIGVGLACLLIGAGALFFGMNMTAVNTQPAPSTQTSVQTQPSNAGAQTSGQTPAGNTGTPASSGSSAGQTVSPKGYTLAQVATHKNASSCWAAINGKVYNLTAWINQHPGGPEHILAICGTDGSAAFNAQHAGQGAPAQELATFYIGEELQ